MRKLSRSFIEIHFPSGYCMYWIVFDEVFFIEHIKKTMAIFVLTSVYTRKSFLSCFKLAKGFHFLLASASNLSTVVCYFGGKIINI